MSTATRRGGPISLTPDPHELLIDKAHVQLDVECAARIARVVDDPGISAMRFIDGESSCRHDAHRGGGLTGDHGVFQINGTSWAEGECDDRIAEGR